ncbi:metal ABC transporter solute-binding protein, Zn/Mn family [Bifidobacterium choerinum]|uniref:Metal ion ABC transporter substrate-binding protein n=1 Tax=Bifidobacterium choerinum TaxID=35760 RepID=A0A087AGC0_9BIFI|nr:zinc ABC transporter substrate-binding protein [Bifidobacterium choerinum]KFI57820.1 metal ion ABC transporter substrate-binding protein [Bifidobacterium choerinum]
MKKLMRAVIATFAGVMTIAAVSACSTTGGANADNANSEGGNGSAVITVIASSNQWGSLAKDLGGKYVDVTSILNNTGTDAHDYEPTTNDISKIQNAQIAIVNGAGYDDWALKAAQQSSKTLVVDAADASGAKTGDNPHIWFSANARIKTADAITKDYIKLQPEHKAQFEQLHKTWLEEEQQLDKDLKELAKDKGSKNYAAVESVAQYLAEDMGLTDVTPKGYKQAAANESEPTPADIKAFTDLLKKGDMRMLITNSQEPSKMNDQLVAAADSGNVPVVDVTEQMPEQYKSLHEWMRALAKQIQETDGGSKSDK